MKNIVSTETGYGKFRVLKNDYIGKIFMKKNHYEKQYIDVLKFYIIPNTNVLDIGANLGVHTIPYAKHEKTAIIHAFEPQSFIYNNLLLENIKNNNITNTKTYNLAVGNKNQEVTLSSICVTKKLDYDDNTHKWNFGGLNLGKNGEKTNMITIDSLNLDSLSYIKIDVEGAEKLVILGALETIKKYRPVVFVEQLLDITKDMIEMLNLTSQEVKFDILKYFVHELKYQYVYKLGCNYLLVPDSIRLNNKEKDLEKVII